MKTNDFYEQWQQHKPLETMEMSETWANTCDKRHIHQLQPETTNKIH